ncbi:MAG: DUF5610 domain-containing protein [Gammaproteobacteria bacterium]|nr:DUF5610 domain-containing protein [Gammaproteobacteria bacterium]
MVGIVSPFQFNGLALGHSKNIESKAKSIGVSIPKHKDFSQIFNNKLADNLRTQFEKKHGKLDLGSDYSPQAVANRILSFVDVAVNKKRAEEGDVAAQELLQKASKGIEKGYNDAVTILKGLGVFNGEVQENAEATYDLLIKGVYEIESGLKLSLEKNDEKTSVENVSFEAHVKKDNLAQLSKEFLAKDNQAILAHALRVGYSTKDLALSVHGHTKGEINDKVVSYKKIQSYQTVEKENETKEISTLLKSKMKPVHGILNALNNVSKHVDVSGHKNSHAIEKFVEIGKQSSGKQNAISQLEFLAGQRYQDILSKLSN